MDRAVVETSYDPAMVWIWRIDESIDRDVSIDWTRQLNTATSYDDRCRIRAQLRIVRKKQGVTGSSPMTSRRTPSQTTSSHTSVSSESNSVSRRTYASTPSAKKAVEPQPSVDEPSPEAPQQANVQQTVVIGNVFFSTFMIILKVVVFFYCKSLLKIYVFNTKITAQLRWETPISIR